MNKKLTAASEAVQKNENKRFSKTNKRLNAIGDKVEGGSSVVSADTISAGYGLLEGQISTWVQASQTLVTVLDDVQKLHPFIGIAVMAFKAAINMELKRRENDRKIVSLQVVMKDMMSTLVILNRLDFSHSGQNEKTVEDQLVDLINNIADGIQKFAGACDIYYEQKLITKIFKSSSWGDKLTAFGEMFVGHKDEIQARLTIRSNFELDEATSSLQNINVEIKSTKDMVSMTALITQIHSPKERELMKWIDSKGGPDVVMQNDALFKDLMAMSDKGFERDTDSRAQAKLTTSVRAEIRADFDVSFKNNEIVFRRKFEAQQRSIEAVEQQVQKQGDRVYKAITEGPHERVMDPDLRMVWKDMKWRGSVKARHLILALRDHYIDVLSLNSFPVPAVGRNASSAESDSGNSAVVKAITERSRQISQDEWTFQYISVMRLQPLMEAFDHDVSGFVTVNEANLVTTSCPLNWSVPHWLAYWAVGFEMSLYHYSELIVEKLTELHQYANDTLPGNRAFVDRYISSITTMKIDALLAPLDEYDWDEWDESLWGRFSPFIESEEKRLKENLDNFAYNIDALNSLELIAGSGRLEKNILPILYLLLQRDCKLMKLSSYKLIHRDEFLVSLDSLGTIWTSVNARVADLRAVFKHQDIDENAGFRKSVHGLFSLWDLEDEWTDLSKSEFYSWNYFDDDESSDEGSDVDSSEVDETSEDSSETSDESREWQTDGEESLPTSASYVQKTLKYGPQEDSLDCSSYEEPTYKSQSELVGCWFGSCYFSSGTVDCPMNFIVNSASENGYFSGYGYDSTGKFIIAGRLASTTASDTSLIRFRKSYAAPVADSLKCQWRFEGILNCISGEVSGRYGRDAEGHGSDFLSDHLTDEVVGGSFAVHHRRYEYKDFLLSSQSKSQSRANILWKFAIVAVKHQVRSEKFHWSLLVERREQRKRFIDLLTRREESNTNWMDHLDLTRELTSKTIEELGNLENTLHPRDLVFYRSLAAFISRRTVYHNLYCDSCERDIVHTLFLCLDCHKPSDLEGDKFCQKCIGKEYHSKEDSIDHNPSHPSLQLRRGLAERRTNVTVKRAKNCLQTTQEVSGGENHELNKPTCSRCKSGLTRPFWTCVECEDNMYLCDKCNAEDNKEKPWLYKHTDLAPEGHSYFHGLVKCSEAAAPLAPSVEERISRIEKRLDTIDAHNLTVKKWMEESESKTQSRMEKLENLLTQLLIQK